MKKLLCNLTLFILLTFTASAFDFGLTTYQSFSADNANDNDNYEYKADIIPSFSFFFGDKSELFVSLGMTIGTTGEFYCLPELLRAEYSLRLGALGLRLGRISYKDPLAFITDGIFDGVQFSCDTSVGTFSLGAWYTGFLYKRNADITMTAKDMEAYNAPLDYNDFANTYFAPKRFLVSLDYDHPSIREKIHIKSAVTAQFDLTEKGKYNSQYFTLKLIMPVKSFSFELGGSLQTAEFETENAQNEITDEFNIAFAADAGVYWTLPTPFTSRLALTGRVASGNSGGTVGAFIPITTKVYTDIYQPKLSALTILNLNYTGRLLKTLGASLSASHFIRNDLGTIRPDKKEGYSLGTEFFARFIWSPLSDIQLNLGGGVFLPVLGNVNQNDKAQWRVETTLVWALW